MAISIVPCIGLIHLCITLLYPLYASATALVRREKEDSSSQELVQWTVFWCIYVMYSAVETSLLFFLVDYLPLYYEMKCAVFLWLESSEYQGAAYLWQEYLAPAFDRVDPMVLSYLKKAPFVHNVLTRTTAGVPLTDDKKFADSRTLHVDETKTAASQPNNENDVAAAGTASTPVM